MITPAQLDYFEQLPVFDNDLAFEGADECLAQMQLAIDLFPDFVTLLKSLRLATLQPGSSVYSDHFSLTERWMSMLARSILEDTPLLDKLIPLTAHLLTEQVRDPLDIPDGLDNLNTQILEIRNHNSPATSWISQQADEFDLTLNNRNIDQFEVVFPGIFTKKVKELVKKIDPAVAELIDYARQQGSVTLEQVMPSLTELVHYQAFAYHDPIRKAVLGESVSPSECARRLKMLISDCFPMSMILRSTPHLADQPKEWMVEQVRRVHGLIEHLDNFDPRDLNIDLYAAFTSAKSNQSWAKYERIEGLLESISLLGADVCSLAVAVTEQSWAASRMSESGFQQFVIKASDFRSWADKEKIIDRALCRQFLIDTPVERLLACDLEDSVWVALYQTRPEPAFVKKVLSDSALENTLAFDMGL